MKRHGIHLAVVTESGGAGARVKLQFPWLPDGDASAWARVAAPLAGPGAGCWAMPAVGDQVAVVFEHGDIDRPIVVGALWSQAQPPPETTADVAMLKSRGGHRVIFDDRDGRVTIVDATRASRIVLDGDGAAVRVESAGDLAIRAARDVVIDARELAIASHGTLAIAGRDVAIRAGTLSVTASNEIVAAGSSVTARSGGES